MRIFRVVVVLYAVFNLALVGLGCDTNKKAADSDLTTGKQRANNVNSAAKEDDTQTPKPDTTKIVQPGESSDHSGGNGRPPYPYGGSLGGGGGQRTGEQCSLIGESTQDYLLRHKFIYQPSFDKRKPLLGSLPIKPSLHTNIVSCMDARVSPYDIFGLDFGESHVFRNAGGIVTDDVIRSLLISQRLLSTNEIIVMHHLDCGMAKFTDAAVSNAIESAITQRTEFRLEFFTDEDPVKNVRENVKRILNSPFILNKCNIFAAIYVDVFNPNNPSHVALQALYPALALGEDKEGKVIQIDVSDITSSICGEPAKKTFAASR